MTERPPAVSWETLRRLAAWSREVNLDDGEPDRIGIQVADYARQHGLGPPPPAPAAAPPPEPPTPEPSVPEPPAPEPRRPGLLARMASAVRRLGRPAE
jgi:hypothetical protein